MHISGWMEVRCYLVQNLPDLPSNFVKWRSTGKAKKSKHSILVQIRISFLETAKCRLVVVEDCSTFFLMPFISFSLPFRAAHLFSRWYILPYRQALTRPPVMFECFIVTRPPAVLSSFSGCSRTRRLARTDGYTYLVSNVPSNMKSILDSASSTFCPQELASESAQRTTAHTCRRRSG